MSSHSVVAPEKLAKAVNYVAAQLRISRNTFRNSSALTGKISEKAVDDETLNGAPNGKLFENIVNDEILHAKICEHFARNSSALTGAISEKVFDDETLQKVVELERVLDKAVKRIEETETIMAFTANLLKKLDRRMDNLADALDNQCTLTGKLTDAVADDKAAISAFDHRFSANQNEVDDIAENVEELNNNSTYLLRRRKDCVPKSAYEPPTKRKAKAKG